MRRNGGATTSGLRVLSRGAFVRLVAIFLAVGVFVGTSTPALARTSDDKTFLAFTSDVHNKSDNLARNRLDAWIDTMCTSYGGKIDYMGFCGDMGDAQTSEANFWSYSEQAMLVVDQKMKDGKIAQACYTTGNHEFNPGNFTKTTSSLVSRYTVDAYAPSVPEGANYYLYCLGSRNNNQSGAGYTSDQIKALSDFLDSCGTDKPIFVMTHFPLHRFSSRTTANAIEVIELLNKHADQKKTIVLLWGHNHSQKDTNYDTIFTPGTTISYSSNGSKAFNFYYLAAGCMSDSEYTGSESVKGKGLVITIDDATDAMTFTYYNASGATVATHSTKPTKKYTITWKNDDGTTLATTQVDEGAVPQYTGETPTKSPTEQNSYTFSGWTPTPVAATQDATYTATYTAGPRTYTITWKDGDGNTLKTDSLAYGATPQYSGATPTKTATAQYTYTFNNTWSLTISTVTKDATYTANFTQSVRSYTITWKDGDGNTLKTETLEYGARPSYTGSTPTKTATAQYTYTFNNSWSPTVLTVTGDATYTAQFSSTVNKYTITWVDGDGKTLKTEQVEYGKTPSYTGATPTKAATAQYTYTFNNSWSPTVTSVTKDATYTAQFSSTVNKYTVRFVDYDGTEISSRQYEYGTAASSITKPADPTRPPSGQTSYTFVGWTPEIARVTGDATYTATYTTGERTYTITWVDGDGNTLKTDALAYGATPSYSGATPTKKATAQYTYTFNNTWSPAITTVTGNATYSAQFSATVNKYTITWIDGDGNTLKTEQLEYGQTPSYTGSTPTKTPTAQYTYAFSGSWSPAITSVTKNATYTAQFNASVNTYAITWLDGDGHTLKTEQVEYGKTPSYTGATPTKTATAQFTYTFNNTWSPTIESVTGDATYTAQFNATVNVYTVRFVDYDGTVLLAAKKYDYGTDSTAIQTPANPKRPADAQYTYTFAGWDPQLATVTKDATYTAVYESAPVEEPIQQTSWKRLSGNNRYATMAEIVQEGFTSSNVAVLASGERFPDALVASSVAGALHCPVVLTAKDKLSTQAASELKRLGVTEVYVMGGTGTVSQAVEDTLVSELGLKSANVHRVWGSSRDLTSADGLRVIDELGQFDGTVVVATGYSFADALSIGPWCYASSTPILLTGKDGKLTKGQLGALEGYTITRVIAVGGSSSVKDEVADQLGLDSSNAAQFKRLSGSDRYLTSAAIATWEIEEQGMTVANVAVTMGKGKDPERDGFADALAGAALCGTNNSVLILANDALMTKTGNARGGLKVIEDHSADVVTGYVLGGTSSVSASLFEYLESLTA